MSKLEEVKVTVRQFLTKPSTNPAYKDKKPVPMRTMFGYVKEETQYGVYVVLRGKPTPSSSCLHCGREITHPVSLYAMFGSTCLPTHYPHIYAMVSNLPSDQIDKAYEILKEQLADITWEGWLPKGHIEIEKTGDTIEPFSGKVADPKNVVTPATTPATPTPAVEVKRTSIKKAPEVVVDEKLIADLVNELGIL